MARAWSWEDGRTILPTSRLVLATNFNKFFPLPFSSFHVLPSSQLHIRFWHQILTNFSSFLFPLQNVLPSPQLHFGVLGSIFLTKCEVGKTGGQERGKGKRKKFVKICCQTQTWNWEDRPPVLPSSQLHARAIYKEFFGTCVTAPYQKKDQIRR